MAAGLKVLVPLLAALLLLVVAHTASASWTKSEESCKKVSMRHCEKHIMRRIEHEDEDEDDEEERVLRMRGIKHHLPRSDSDRSSDEEDERKQCCDQLRDLDSSECQCRAMQKIMERKGDRLERKELKDMKRELKNLPMTCGLGGPLFGCKLTSDD